MVTKKGQKAVKNGGAKRVEIKLNPNELTNRIYSNHVEINQTPLEVTLSFCDVDPTSIARIKEFDDHVEIPAKTKARIVLPRPVFDNFQNVLVRMAKGEN